MPDDRTYRAFANDPPVGHVGARHARLSGKVEALCPVQAMLGLPVLLLGKQMLITRGALTTFSVANDVSKYFAMIPAMFFLALPGLSELNVMRLATPQSAILSALIFNAVIILLLIPLALRGVRFRPISAEESFYRNLMVYGLGGLVAPFIGIKLIDLGLSAVLLG